MHESLVLIFGLGFQERLAKLFGNKILKGLTVRGAAASVCLHIKAAAVRSRANEGLRSELLPRESNVSPVTAPTTPRLWNVPCLNPLHWTALMFAEPGRCSRSGSAASKPRPQAAA
ncbi:hypothetical protein SKAU_G00271880 [Synaphobranchus kaupii]|uniref:Uncharacterized protein n=1 Tax=Synaphobranchus kaupii TaxID=118154 RepID=A0A9Q1IQN3_SYNKA|nr:hypothetical protein SKAU_G00271880 [Synaphobranchus kaupii]